MQTQTTDRIKVGDTVKIVVGSVHRSGVIISLDGSEMRGWNIEFQDANGEYGYWKQAEDGGVVRVIERGPELPTLEGVVRVQRDHCQSDEEFWEKLESEVPGFQKVYHGRHDHHLGFMRSWELHSDLGGAPVTVYHESIRVRDCGEGELLLVGQEAIEFWEFIYNNESSQLRLAIVDCYRVYRKFNDSVAEAMLEYEDCENGDFKLNREFPNMESETIETVGTFHALWLQAEEALDAGDYWKAGEMYNKLTEEAK